MCFVFHTYPPKGYASDGVFVWSRYSIIPWVPWSTYLSPKLVESHLACHPSSQPLRDTIAQFQWVVIAAGWGPGRTHLRSLRMQGRLGSWDAWRTKLRNFWRRRVPAEGRTPEEATVQFWMPREVGLSAHCAVPTGKGKAWGLLMRSV